MERWLLWCIMLVICVGQSYGDATHISEETETKLEQFMFRLATDMGSMMSDIKTLVAFKSQQHAEMEEEKERGGVIGTCSGVTGLTTFSVHNVPMTVPCADQTWIVVMRRVDNTHNFATRGWEDYKMGFGNPGGSFWLGLANIHALTFARAAKLHVALTDWDGETRWAQYSYFRVEGESAGYRLMVSGYTGTAGDSLEYHSGMPFTTHDKDNDEHETVNCAEKYSGGWWHASCFNALLTGRYRESGAAVHDWHGIIWYHWKGKDYSYKHAEMRILVN
jgi:hypothetical protein